MPKRRDMTLQEIKNMITMRAERKPWKEIAKKLKRSEGFLRKKASELGIPKMKGGNIVTIEPPLSPSLEDTVKMRMTLINEQLMVFRKLLKRVAESNHLPIEDARTLAFLMQSMVAFSRAIELWISGSEVVIVAEGLTDEAELEQGPDL